MAKFCTNCGSPLEEGKVCDCEKNEVRTVSKKESNKSDFDFGKEIKNIFSEFLNLFKNPTKVVEGKKVSKFAWIFVMAIQVIVIFITLLFGFDSLMSLATGGFSIGSFGIQIPVEVYVKLFFMIIVICLVFLFLFVSIVYLFMNKIFKIKCNYMEVLNKLSYPSLIIAVAIFAGVIGSMIHSVIGIGILMFGFIYYILIVANIISSYFKAGFNKDIYAITISIILTIGGGIFIILKLSELMLSF